MIVSASALIASVALMIVCVSRRGDGVHMAYAHMCLAALVAIGFAASYFRRFEELRRAGASEGTLAATTSRFVGYVWGWGAVCLLTTYATGVLVWREWTHFTLACVILAAICLLFGTMLQRDADAGKEDRAMLNLAHWLAIALLGGMVVTIVGLLLDGKMVRFREPRFMDWPGNNIFFFGAVAIAAITGYSLRSRKS